VELHCIDFYDCKEKLLGFYALGEYFEYFEAKFGFICWA